MECIGDTSLWYEMEKLLYRKHKWLACMVRNAQRIWYEMVLDMVHVQYGHGTK